MKTSPLVNRAEGSAFAELASMSQERVFRSGETIIDQSGSTHHVGIILAGVLKVVRSLPDGRSHIVELLHPPDFFGRLYAESSEFSVEAATNVTLCLMERNAFEAFLAKYPDIEHELYLASLAQLDRARERIMLLACQSTLERLAAYLAMRLLQTEMDAPSPLGSGRIVVGSPIGRRDFAGYLGTTVETISRNVQHLSRRGVIRILDSSNFEVLQRGPLFALSGQSEEDLTASTMAQRTVVTKPGGPRRLNVLARLGKKPLPPRLHSAGADEITPPRSIAPGRRGPHGQTRTRPGKTD